MKFKRTLQHDLDEIRKDDENNSSQRRISAPGISDSTALKNTGSINPGSDPGSEPGTDKEQHAFFFEDVKV